MLPHKIPLFLPASCKKSGPTEIELLSKVSEYAIFTRVFLTEISLQKSLKRSSMTSLVSNYVINRNPKFPISAVDFI